MRHYILSIFLAAALCASCQPADRDMEQPSILESHISTCPTDCEQFALADTMHFCYRFTDNAELGNYNIEVHNNFEHHTHSTSAAECEQEAEKEPLNPWVFNRDYPIPEGLTDYTAHVDIPIPADVDPGDYHFMVRLTDRSGWQQIRSVAIKLR